MLNFISLLPLCLAVEAAESMALEVRETAGIRRFGYPVSTELEPGKPLAASTRFRLLLEGAPVAAQFRALPATAGSTPRVALDFEGNFLPFEGRRYTVEYGAEVPAGPEPQHGLKLEETAGGFRILNGELAFSVRKDLEGLLASVVTPAGDYLKPGSAGLRLRDRNGPLHPLLEPPGRFRARVLKNGPLAVRLRFDGGEGATPVAVEIEIPRSKSWAQVSVTAEDPSGSLAGIEVDLGLNLAAEKTLADFGAVGLVYAALSPGQSAHLRGGLPAGAVRGPGRPFWEVLRGPPGKLEPYVLGPRDGPPVPLEGWAHAMDPDRCTAAAVKDFARGSEDLIEVAAGRGLRIARAFNASGGSPGKKSLVFWVHFVNSPPHVGAVTSPQAMAAPLETRWEKR